MLFRFVLINLIRNPHAPLPPLPPPTRLRRALEERQSACVGLWKDYVPSSIDNLQTLLSQVSDPLLPGSSALHLSEVHAGSDLCLGHLGKCILFSGIYRKLGSQIPPLYIPSITLYMPKSNAQQSYSQMG